jgi:hypothetical protein
MKERQNILFGKIEVYNGKKNIIIEDVVFIEECKTYKKMNIIKVIESKIIGKTNISKEYTEVKMNNETRNKITGNYE